LASNRRFILIGKIVVEVVKAPDAILTRVFNEMKQLNKIKKRIRSKSKRIRSKSKRKETKAELKARMVKVRSARK
jgi:hypothetical protein